MDSGLYIVATPIGNLRDITLRALDVLRSADVILAEDTRQTRKLLDAYDIETPLTAYHDHNAAKRIPGILTRLDAGQIVAQVSDAGTPLVSDPGFKLVRAAAEAGHLVVPIPGASALLAGLVVAGLPSDRFLFAGFLPAKKSVRRRELAELAMVRASLVFFESPGRVGDCLADLKDALGDRPAILARELTKKFEETRRGTLSDLLESIQDDPPRGEIVLVVGPPDTNASWTESDVDKALLDCLADMGVKHASQHVAELAGWKRRDVYQRALSLK